MLLIKIHKYCLLKICITSSLSPFFCNSLYPMSLLQYDVNGDGKPGGGGEYEVQVLMVCSYLHIHKSAFGAGHSASETF